MGAYPIDEAELVSLFMGSASYGVYLVTLGMCIRCLFWGRFGRKERYNWPLVIVAASMFVFTTLDVSFALKHCIDAFISYKGSGGPNAVFEDVSSYVNVIRVGLSIS